MLVMRWQAPLVPEKQQLIMLFEAEGLNPDEETLAPKTEIKDVRNPFDEVLAVASGELHLDIAGNKLLLRAGDRILIPSNTRHSKRVDGDKACTYISAHKVF